MYLAQVSVITSTVQSIVFSVNFVYKHIVEKNHEDLKKEMYTAF